MGQLAPLYKAALTSFQPIFREYLCAYSDADVNVQNPIRRLAPAIDAARQVRTPNLVDTAVDPEDQRQ
jgi:hypothetical protein